MNRLRQSVATLLAVGLAVNSVGAIPAGRLPSPRQNALSPADGGFGTQALQSPGEWVLRILLGPRHDRIIRDWKAVRQPLVDGTAVPQKKPATVVSITSLRRDDSGQFIHGMYVSVIDSRQSFVNLSYGAIVRFTDEQFDSVDTVGTQLITEAGEAVLDILFGLAKPSLGQVVVTPGGILASRYLFHVPIPINGRRTSDDPGVMQAIIDALKTADAQGLDSILIPSLGAVLGPDDTATQMFHAISQYLGDRGENASLVKITIRAEDAQMYAALVSALKMASSSVALLSPGRPVAIHASGPVGAAEELFGSRGRIYARGPDEFKIELERAMNTFGVADPPLAVLEYAVYRWILIGTMRATLEGLPKKLTFASEGLRASAEYRRVDIFKMLEPFLDESSIRLASALDIFGQRSIQDLIEKMQGIVLVHHSPPHLHYLMRMHPSTTALFGDPALDDRESLHGAAVVLLGMIEPVTSFAQGVVAAAQATAKIAQLLEPMSSRNSFYRSIKLSHPWAFTFWNSLDAGLAIGLGASFRRQFPDGDKFWTSDKSLAAIYHDLLTEYDRDLPPFDWSATILPLTLLFANAPLDFNPVHLISSPLAVFVTYASMIQLILALIQDRPTQKPRTATKYQVLNGKVVRIPVSLSAPGQAPMVPQVAQQQQGGFYIRKRSTFSRSRPAPKKREDTKINPAIKLIEDDKAEGILTSQQIKIVTLRSQGEGNKDIASLLGITPEAVKNHILKAIARVRTPPDIYRQRVNIFSRIRDFVLTENETALQVLTRPQIRAILLAAESKTTAEISAELNIGIGTAMKDLSAGKGSYRDFHDPSSPNFGRLLHNPDGTRFSDTTPRLASAA